MSQLKEIVRNNYVSRKGHINLRHTGQLIDKAILQNEDILLRKFDQYILDFSNFLLCKGLNKTQK